MTYKNAFVSVYDKTGLYEFLKPMKDLKIISTGGTAKYLKSKRAFCYRIEPKDSISGSVFRSGKKPSSFFIYASFGQKMDQRGSTNTKAT